MVWFLAALAVFGFGQLEAWPYTSWYMFSHVEPKIARVAQPYAVTSSGDVALDATTLPFGLLSHRLLRRIDEGPDPCAQLVRAARRRHPTLIAVRVEERRWDPLVRGVGNAPVMATIERTRCPV